MLFRFTLKVRELICNHCFEMKLERKRCEMFELRSKIEGWELCGRNDCVESYSRCLDCDYGILFGRTENRGGYRREEYNDTYKKVVDFAFK